LRKHDPSAPSSTMIRTDRGTWYHLPVPVTCFLHYIHVRPTYDSISSTGTVIKLLFIPSWWQNKRNPTPPTCLWSHQHLACATGTRYVLLNRTIFLVRIIIPGTMLVPVRTVVSFTHLRTE
jgi:hypothetical protein